MNKEHEINDYTKVEKTDRLRKGIECVHCERIFVCKGAINPENCINFLKRKKSPET